MQNTINQRIKIVRENSNKSQGDFAESISITRGNLSQIELGNQKPSIDVVREIVKIYNISWDWLLEGVEKTNTVNDPGEKFLKPDAVKIELSSGIMRVPLVSQYAYAGYLGGYSDVEFMEALPTIPFIIDREYKGIYMAFEVRGDSMDDGSRDSYIAGDILLSRQVAQPHWRNKLHINRWDFVIVHKTDGILLKKIISHIPDTGDIIAHSLNPDYDDISLNLSDVVQLFNVVKVERKK